MFDITSILPFCCRSITLLNIHYNYTCTSCAIVCSLQSMDSISGQKWTGMVESPNVMCMRN